MNLGNIFKYILEGLAVAVAAYFIPNRRTSPMEVLYIAITAAATFMVLDLFAPSVGAGARQGTGFGVGLNQVGWQAGGQKSNGDNAVESEAENSTSESEDSDGENSTTEANE